MGKEKVQTGNTWDKQIDDKGAFKREPTNWQGPECQIKADGSTKFKPEADRYHLYLSWACPWAHRTLAVRTLKGLESVISTSFVHYLLDDEGWHFKRDATNPPAKDDLYDADLMREVYAMGVESKEYDGRVTVPVLWDKKTKQIVNNESSEIIIMLNNEFNEFATKPDVDLYPRALRAAIEEVNEWVYPLINNGVYKAGFAKKQAAYEEAFHGVFEGLDKVEALLSKQRYLTGECLTLADVRLWTTLVRFDAVYHYHFKCNKALLCKDYPNAHHFMLEIAQMPGMNETIDMQNIKDHYYQSHKSINPHAVVPIGMPLDFIYTEKHNRATKFPIKKRKASE